ncbi:KilA-N domain-containing protein [Basilea psittacipulmonis]|uniref:KilA-N domain-containing protein n=1 Tax=Basilea psittacipulmonis TaxID=1472345 RepID=UPI000691B38D|nr:KilA-N domain-containing protein [Basilea psittacipulmonis]
MNIQISNTNIRQNEYGLFSLNDLHKASGKEKRHQPSNWLSTQQTIELIKELQAPVIQGAEQNQQVIQVKNGIGTFVCKELVYAYATWISAKFFLLVIRTFDQVASGSYSLTPAQKQTIREAVKLRNKYTGEHWQTIYDKLHTRFRVNTYHEILASDFENALQFLGVGRQPVPTTKPATPKGVFISYDLLESIGYAVLNGMRLKNYVEPMYQGLRSLRLDPEGSLRTLLYETDITYERVWKFIQDNRQENWRLTHEVPSYHYTVKMIQD